MNVILNTGRYLYALTMLVFGIQHFRYAGYVARMVPGWIPWHLFWTYLVGAAFVAFAIAVAINKMARIACILLGAMILLFVIIIHVPGVIQHIQDGSGVTEMFEDLGLGAGAFILSSAFPPK